MRNTIERLLEGRHEVADHYFAAKKKWDELFEQHKDGSITEWSAWITDNQFWFEGHCGGRWPGQEVMAWSGFGCLYSTQSGFENTLSIARKLDKAFQKSMSSIECKGSARRAATAYGVNEE